MEAILRTGLIGWLAADPALLAALNTIIEEAPTRTAAPWLALVASTSTDWSTKDRTGREVRLAFELYTRGEEPEQTASLAGLVEARIAAAPATHPALLPGLRIVSQTFLRARVEQRANHARAVLLEYRFRVLEN